MCFPVPTGGYVVSVMEQKDGIIRTGYIFSVNFFGLSTLDKKRGPEGCIDFCYKTKTIGKKPPSLQVGPCSVKNKSDIGCAKLGKPNFSAIWCLLWKE